MSDDRPEPSPQPPPAVDFKDLFDHAPCGYLSLGPDSRVVLANATLARWIGCSPDDLVGKHLRDLLTTPSRIFYETNFAPLLRLSGGFEETALDFRTAAGGKLSVLVNAAERRGSDGLVCAIRVTVARATERRGYESDLRGREAAAVQSLGDERATSELREQFIAVLGHDLRNPLASVAAAASILRREGQTEKALSVLHLMDGGVERMARLIDEVLDFARGRLGSGIDLQRETAALEPVLRQVVSELELGEAGRTVICELDLPEPISFDAGRIAQLTSNLLSNAFTHGDPNQPVRLRAATADRVLTLSVSNAGRPIPPAAMERLFQPFFRGQVRPSRHGLGLGLHIASEIARAHGGALQVQSNAEETRFTLTMPLI